ncbi:MAG TPA: hypothetical protein VKA63_12080 [Candidatus Krumholzibacteria bacterium]|nr:hypothetical protein [Candidatus Krumholzibacteria bacterium]
MSQLIDRLRFRAAPENGAAYWRRVPTIDMTPRRPSPWTTAAVLRGSAVALLLVELLLLGHSALSWQNADAQQPALTRELKNIQETRSGNQSALDQLQHQLATLQKQRASQTVSTSDPAWATALSGLFGMQTPGIRLRSAFNDPKQSANLIVQGDAAGLGAIAQFQTDIRVRSQYFTLEGIQWNAGAQGLQFTATLRIAARGVSNGTP